MVRVLTQGFFTNNYKSESVKLHICYEYLCGDCNMRTEFQETEQCQQITHLH